MLFHDTVLCTTHSIQWRCSPEVEFWLVVTSRSLETTSPVHQSISFTVVLFCTMEYTESFKYIGNKLEHWNILAWSCSFVYILTIGTALLRYLNVNEGTRLEISVLRHQFIVTVHSPVWTWQETAVGFQRRDTSLHTHTHTLSPSFMHGSTAVAWFPCSFVKGSRLAIILFSNRVVVKRAAGSCDVTVECEMFSL